MSLRLRLLLTLAPLFVVGLVAADVGTYASLQSFLVSRLDDQLSSAHPGVERMLQGTRFDPGGRGDGGGGPGNPTSLPSNTYAELLTPTGTVVTTRVFSFDPTGAADMSAHPLLPMSVTQGSITSPQLLTVDGGGRVGRYRTYVERAGDGNTLVIAAPLDEVSSTLNRLVLLEIALTGGITVVVVVATWLLVRRGLRPLERMGRTARSIVASDLGQRITPATEKTEVGRLGLALNAMLSQLDKAFAERAASEQRLRHFVSDASHELRTPLTSMRGYAELLRRNPEMDREDLLVAMRRVEDEAERMGSLVDELLLLARLDQGRPLERGPVDLEALVMDACSDARVVDPRRRITPRIRAPLTVVGDNLRLRQAVGNLVRNALVHTPAGTPVEIELRAQDGRAIIEVVDHGPGIAAADAERVFERFHRADPRRSRDQGGSGLGLSIAAAVVGAHGGRIAVEATPGGGATFRIEVPALSPEGSPAASAAASAAAASSSSSSAPPAPTARAGELPLRLMPPGSI